MPKKSLLPFLILGFGFAWMALFEWLRNRSSKQHRASGFAPGIQHLTLVGLAGLLLCMIAAGVAAYIKWFP